MPEMFEFDRDPINRKFQNTRRLFIKQKIGVSAQSGMILMIGSKKLTNFRFLCRMFAHKVPESVGKVDPAFTSSRTHSSGWKAARSAIHKQAALHHNDYQITQVNLQLDEVAGECIHV